MDTSLAIRKDTSIIHTFADAENAAKAMARSGYFQDSKDAAQAIVKILAGQELGFGPFASITGVYIIQGRPSIGANLMAAAVKGSGRYDYRVTENTDQVCEITFFEQGKEIGKSKFTHADAVKAGTKNLDKFPRNMLFARAMSNGVRWFTPDAFNGNAVYTPEELGADVDIEGNVIPGSFQEVTPESIPQPKPAPVPNGTRPYSPDALKERIQVLADSFAGSTCTDGNRTSVRISLAEMAGGEDNYHTLLSWLIGTQHIAEATPEQVLALKKWIGSKKQADDTWLPDAMSITEAKAAYTEALKAQGQETLPLE